MAWWNRKKEQRDLLETLLNIEAKKAEIRGNVELRKLELEADTIAERAKVEQEIREWKAKKREQVRALGIKNRDNPKRRGRGGRWQQEACCELGADPNTRNVTIEMIKAHRLHEAGLPSQSPSENLGDQATGDLFVPKVPTELGN